ncbi:hypothetical protein BD410DRAFT_802359 [Rickenella mellea]|uniref:Uncharacterized protein n=1 Tax=Rickenella mellea TaxID=50990 RepID=A0A4Y7Q8S7_9AGAM|nr:hypothetical protein BD410DRAFT_802359 [Rickenella mellea]
MSMREQLEQMLANATAALPDGQADGDDHDMSAVEDVLNGGTAHPPSELHGMIVSLYHEISKMFQDQTRTLLGQSIPTAGHTRPAPPARPARLPSAPDVPDDSPPSNLPLPAKTRNCPGPRGEDNDLNAAIRTFLRRAKLLSTPSPKGEKPWDASKFPAPTTMAVDWQESFRSEYNKEIFGSLADAFITELKAGAYKNVEYNEEAHGWKIIMTKLATALLRERRSKRQAVEDASLDMEPANVDAKTGPRRYARRVETYNRRARIIVENRDNDKVWDDVDMMLKVLGSGGVSDDETDDDELPPATVLRPGNKTVRRVRLAWIAREITDLFDAVESYRDAHLHLKHRQARGQSAPARLFTPKRVDKERAPVHGLPRNWYNPTYYSTLKPSERRLLEELPELPIPTLLVQPTYSKKINQGSAASGLRSCLRARDTEYRDLT